LGSTEMHHLGLDSFVAYNVDEFIEKGRYWATELAMLADLRTTMRQRFAESPLGDEVAFGNATETCLRAMWQNWCSETAEGEATSSGALTSPQPQ
jgi:predicted O-linked N-acetylglucosamine transferase (SPINDLY family)